MKYIDAEKLAKAIEDKGLDCSFALKMERLDILALIDSLQQEQSNSKDLLEWAKKKFNEVEIAMETGADDPVLWGERNAFKQVIDKLNSM